MASFLALFIMALAIVSPVAKAEEIGISLAVHWLHTDGAYAWGGYDEGDTAILFCVGQVSPPSMSFDSIEIHWLRHGYDDWVTIADHENIIFYDGRRRFSRPNLTINSQNETEYRMAISPIDRFDDGGTPRFGCEFGVDGTIGFKRRIAKGVHIRWNPPSTTCSGSILPNSKAKKGDEVSYYCNVTDDDRLSRGSVTLWNGDVQLDVDETKAPLSAGYEYNISYTNTVTDDTANYVYMCRFSATGGYEEYKSNCTFNRPLCVVDDLADPCPGSSSADYRRFTISSIYMGLLAMISSTIVVI